MSAQESSTTKSIEIFDNDTLAAAICFLRNHGTFSRAVTLRHSRPARKSDSPRLQISIVFCSHAGFLDATIVGDFVHALNATSFAIEEVRYTFDSRFWAQANSANYYHGPKLEKRVYSSIGCLPHLISLHWDGSGQYDPDCQSQLAGALEGARNLVRLGCADIAFLVDDYRFDAFLMELQNHPVLSEITFADCFMSAQVLRVSERKWKAFFDALSSIQNLRKLTLSFLAPFDPSYLLSTRAFTSLCAHPKLKILDISGLGSHAILSARQGLRRSNSLKDLTISTQLQGAELLLLGAIVRTQKSLRKLIINVQNYEDDHPMIYLISALEVNSTLTDMKFQFYEGTRFFSNDIQDAMVALLEKRNYTLLSITFDLPLCPEVRNSQAEDMLEYYLCLNRFGRKTIIENLTNPHREPWLATLICSSKSLEALYYFLSLNPGMVHVL